MLAMLMSTYARERDTEKMRKLLEWAIRDLKNLGPLQAVIRQYANMKSPFGLILVFLELSRTGLVPTIRLNHPAISRLALLESQSETTAGYAELLLSHLQQQGDYIMSEMEHHIKDVPNLVCSEHGEGAQSDCKLTVNSNSPQPSQSQQEAFHRLLELEAQTNPRLDVDDTHASTSSESTVPKLGVSVASPPVVVVVAAASRAASLLTKLQAESSQSVLQQLDELAGSGRKIAPQIYETVMELMVQRNDASGGFETFQRLRHHRQSPTSKIYEGLLRLTEQDETISDRERQRRKRGILHALRSDGVVPSHKLLFKHSNPTDLAMNWEDTTLPDSYNVYAPVVPIVKI